MRLANKTIKTLLVLLSLSLLMACHYTVTFEGVSLFNSQGQEFGRLTWDITASDDSNYTPQRVSIAPGIGEVEFTGTLDVFPTQTTTYTMTVEATRDDGTIWNTNKTVTIYIGPRVNYTAFTDTALRACARETGYTHIEQFKTLICYEKGITRLQGIQQLTELTYIGVDYNRISDFSPIQALDKLITLSASDNGITSVSGFPMSDSLSTLVLSYNNIVDPSPLSALTQLDHLTLDHNQISSASTLTSFTGLTSLFVQNNQIRDVGPLGGLNNLQALNLQSNGVQTGVLGLGGLRGIFALDMRNNTQVSCLQYASLYLVLGPALLTNGCRVP